LVLIVLFFLPGGFLSAANNPYEFIQTTNLPATLSQTEISGGEVFTATIKSNSVNVKDATAGEAARISYRFIANNKATGEDLVLNSFYSVKIEPFPKKLGEIYKASDIVPLEFPANSAAGDYLIIAEVIKVEMKTSEFGWQEASAPTKPATPTKPSAPTKPSGTSPAALAKPAEPAPPSEPTQPAEPSRPPKFQEIGIVKYSNQESSAIASTSSPKVSRRRPPLSVSLIELSPNTINAKAAYVSARVTLTEPVPDGGQVVYLSANPGYLVQLPVSIDIDKGDKSGTFGMMVSIATSTTRVAINATLENKDFQKTAWLTLLPPPLNISSLTLSPDSVVGGNSVVGKVTITGNAPAGGQSVYLTCGIDGRLTCPGGLKVPAGTSSVTFNVGTKKAKSLTTRMITARLMVANSATLSATLSINPPPPPCSCQASCPANLTSRSATECAPGKHCRRCGFLWTKKCCSYTPLQCCIPK